MCVCVSVGACECVSVCLERNNVIQELPDAGCGGGGGGGQGLGHHATLDLLPFVEVVVGCLATWVEHRSV